MPAINVVLHGQLVFWYHNSNE